MYQLETSQRLKKENQYTRKNIVAQMKGNILFILQEPKTR